MGPFQACLNWGSIVRDAVEPEVWKLLLRSSRLVKVTTYVSAHLDERLSLARIATFANMEQTSFSKYFKRTTGITYTLSYRESASQKLNRYLEDPTLQ